MFKLKDNISTPFINGEIVVNKVWVENNTLFLIDDNNDCYKQTSGEWFVKTNLTNNEFIPLGVGALPTYTLEKADIENEDAFNLLFEEITNE